MPKSASFTAGPLALVDEDVLRLEIAVDHPRRVRVHERVCERAPDERSELGEPEPHLGRERPERPPADELRDEVALDRRRRPRSRRSRRCPGWESRATARASREKRARDSGAAARCGCRSLTATSRSRAVSRPRYTTAMPAAPHLLEQLVSAEPADHRALALERLALAWESRCCTHPRTSRAATRRGFRCRIATPLAGSGAAL